MLTGNYHSLACSRCGLSVYKEGDTLRGTYKSVLALAYLHKWRLIRKKPVCPKCIKESDIVAYSIQRAHVTKENFQRKVTDDPNLFLKYYGQYTQKYPLANSYGIWVRENYRDDFNVAFKVWAKEQP